GCYFQTVQTISRRSVKRAVNQFDTARIRFCDSSM
ncbi:hypothetical protein M513_09600, partial [Trichuris suis]